MMMRWLTADDLDNAVYCICCINVRDDVLWLSSLTLQAALTQNSTAQPLSKILRTLQCVTLYREQECYEVLFIPVHGPYTEMECASNLHLYEQRNHWSLLVHYKKLGVFVHYDSLAGMNEKRAREIVQFFGALDLFDPEEDADPEYMETPIVSQQHGNWECGYFLLSFVYALLAKDTLDPLTWNDISDLEDPPERHYRFREVLARIDNKE